MLFSLLFAYSRPKESSSCSSLELSSNSCSDSILNFDRKLIGCEIFKKITELIFCHKHPKGGERCKLIRKYFYDSIQFLDCNVERYIRYLENDEVLKAYKILEKCYENCDKKCIILIEHFYDPCNWSKCLKDDCKLNSSSSDISDIKSNGSGYINIITPELKSYSIKCPKKFTLPVNDFNIPSCLVYPELLFCTTMREDKAIINGLLKINKLYKDRGFYKCLMKSICSPNKIEVIHAKFCIIKIFTDILLCKDSSNCSKKYMKMLKVGSSCENIKKSCYYPYFRYVLKDNISLLH